MSTTLAAPADLALAARLTEHLVRPEVESAELAELPWVDPSLVMPSVGSWSHFLGTCRPCAWFHHANGCQHKEECAFCHLCPPGEIKRRKKFKYQLLKQRDERRKQPAAPATPQVPFEFGFDLGCGVPTADLTPSTRDNTPSAASDNAALNLVAERRFEDELALPTLPAAPSFPEDAPRAYAPENVGGVVGADEACGGESAVLQRMDRWLDELETDGAI